MCTNCLFPGLETFTVPQAYACSASATARKGCHQKWLSKAAGGRIVGMVRGKMYHHREMDLKLCSASAYIYCIDEHYAFHLRMATIGQIPILPLCTDKLLETPVGTCGMLFMNP